MAYTSGVLTGSPVQTTDRSTTPVLPVGAVIRDDARGKEWVYVKAGAAIAAFDPVRCAGSAAGYDDVRPTSAAQQLVLGVADAAFASGEYGLVQTKGVATCKVVVATAAGSLLVTGAVANQLELADATDFAGGKPIMALVTGVAAGSAVLLQ